MSRIIVRRFIEAPVEQVFQTVAEIDRFSEAIPHIVKVEMLSEERSGVGARFRETRLMKGREATTELEVTEYVENDRVRLVADSHGTVWDTVFTVEPTRDGTELTMEMEARPHKWLARLLTPLIMGTVSKAVAQDMDAVKDYCEAGGDEERA